jgi:uncharacterized membrane protein YfcA
MQEVTRDAVVSLAAFAAVFGMVYVFLMTRHRERMTMLDRGLIKSPFNQPQNGTLGLKYGMFLIGISAGILMGWVLYNYCGMEDGVSYTAMIFLFGGVSLIASYLITKKNKEE